MYTYVRETGGGSFENRIGVKMVESGRSIPDNVLQEIDDTWGDEIPAVRIGVRRLWGIPVAAERAMELERDIAVAIRGYTMDEGKALTANQARILLNLAPCVDVGPYGLGVHWVDITELAKRIDRNEGHVRRMIIDEKIKPNIIHRPSSGNLAKKRWIELESV